MNIPSADLILLGIAAVLVALSVRGYLRAGKLLPQHKTWLIVAAIFVAVSIATALFT